MKLYIQNNHRWLYNTYWEIKLFIRGLLPDCPCVNLSTKTRSIWFFPKHNISISGCYDIVESIFITLPNNKPDRCPICHRKTIEIPLGLYDFIKGE